MQAKIKWHSETRKITNLKEWDRNPRLLTEKGIKDLTSSINKFGLAEPIVINTDGLIIGGHARFKVLQANGEKEVECYVPNKKLSDEQVEELNIRLNANVAGSWDFEGLANNWDSEQLAEWGLDVPNFTGLTDEEMQTFFKPDDSEQKEGFQKIILEYTDEDFEKVKIGLAKHGKSAEAAVFNLLGL